MSERYSEYVEASDPPPGRRGDARHAVIPGADDEISFVDLLIVLGKYKLMIIALPLIAGLFAAVTSLMKPDSYTANTKLLPPQQGQATGAAALLSQLGSLAGLPVGGGARGTNELYIAMLKSRTLADGLIKRFDLMNTHKLKNPTEAYALLEGAVNITTAKDGLITVEFTDGDPRRAAEFANAYVEELMKLTQVLAVTEASQRRLFFERQLANAKDSLVKAEMAARDAMAQRGLVKVDDQGRAMVEATARLRGQITVKEVQLGVMRAFASEQNPELLRAQREIEVMKRELSKIEGDGAEGPVVKNNRSTGGLGSLHALRDVKYHEVVFELLARQYEVAKIDEAKDSSVIQVLDRAIPPDFRSGPKRTLTVLIYVAIAGVLSIIAAFLLDAFNKSRGDPVRAERLRAFRDSLRWRRGRAQ